MQCLSQNFLHTGNSSASVHFPWLSAMITTLRWCDGCFWMKNGSRHTHRQAVLCMLLVVGNYWWLCYLHPFLTDSSGRQTTNTKSLEEEGRCNWTNQNLVQRNISLIFTFVSQCWKLDLGNECSNASGQFLLWPWRVSVSADAVWVQFFTFEDCVTFLGASFWIAVCPGQHFLLRHLFLVDFSCFCSHTPIPHFGGHPFLPHASNGERHHDLPYQVLPSSMHIEMSVQTNVIHAAARLGIFAAG